MDLMICASSRSLQSGLQDRTVSGAIFYSLVCLTSFPRERPEVRLETLYCGLCGSDLHLLHHAELGDFKLTVPYILGHEATARVLEVGAGVTSLKVGDIVTSEPAIPCDTCAVCRAGHYNWCDICNHQAKGMPGPDAGTCSGFLQRQYLHPAGFCYKLPD